ncbi:MAG: hypothetical protein ACK5MV_00180 [Aminipila sp.]
MKTMFNRFAIIPRLCSCCKRYIWIEKYRRADVYHTIPGEYWKEDICKECVGNYLPKVDNKLNKIKRSERSNIITTLCLDLKTDKWIFKTLDMRKPLERFIPFWIVEEVCGGNK